MPLTPALILAAEDQGVLWVVCGVALAAAFVMGLRLFRNLFEIITAPTASLKFHGENDQFFFSIMLVFLGGLIATAVLVNNQADLSTSFVKYSDAVSESLATQNTNQTYHAEIKEWSKMRLEGNFDTYVSNNLMVFPIVSVVLWVAIGLIAWIVTKIFGGAAALGNFLGTCAYGSFFISIGVGLAGVFIVDYIAGTASGAAASPSGLAIGGVVLALYGLILFVMGINNAAEISAGQTIGVLVGLALIVGGSAYGGFSQGQKMFSAFSSQVVSYNPASQSL